MTETDPHASLTDALLDAVAAGTFVKLTLSKPTPTAGDLKSIDIRPILVKRSLKLSFTYHYRTRDVVKNYPPHEAATLVSVQLAEHFAAAKLLTTQSDLSLARVGGEVTLARQAPTQKAAPELGHDRAKQRRIDTAGKPYLHALGITDAKGVVYKNAQDKFRQMDKYIEILDGLMKPLPDKKLRILDMGAGKGYLTFALYDFLVNTLNRSVEIIGVEYRADLVEKCNAIAQAAEFSGLRFVQGSIAEYDCAGADVVIALHACDTATDDALAKAVGAGAALVVVSPCCHKQIRRVMEGKYGPHGLDFILKHGTYAERMAEMITDAMRAQLMEISGYRTKLFEFISDAHTPKNVMIVAEKRAAPGTAAEDAKAAFLNAKSQFGIDAHQLERLLFP